MRCSRPFAGPGAGSRGAAGSSRPCSACCSSSWSSCTAISSGPRSAGPISIPDYVTGLREPKTARPGQPAAAERGHRQHAGRSGGGRRSRANLPALSRSSTRPRIWSTSTSIRMRGSPRCCSTSSACSGIDWDRTPFFDNKAAFQRGVNQAIRRTSIELVDTLGRVRGTSQIDSDLQSARGNLQFDESTWYFGLSPFGPKTPTPSFYRAAINDLKAFNERLEKCEAVFDARGRQSAAVHRPHRQRHRRHVGDPARPFREVQSRLVRHACRRPLLVRLWATLRLLRHPHRRARRLQGCDRPARAHPALVGAGGPVARGAQHSADDHLQRRSPAG